MTKKNLLLALTFGITAASLPANAAGVKFQESPFQACKEVTFISKADFKENPQLWQEAIQCGMDIQVMPDGAGFFAGVLRSLKSQTGLTGDKLRNEEFLRKVGAKTAEYLDANIATNSAIAACARFANDVSGAKREDLKKLYDPEKCKDMLDDVKDVAEEYGPKVRVEYALTKKLQSVFGTMGDYLSFDALGMKNELDKAPLSEKEQKQVEERFAEIEKRMNEKYAKEMAVYEKEKAEADKLLVGIEQPAFDAQPMIIKNRIRGEEYAIVAKEFGALFQKAPMLAYAAKPGRLSDLDLANAMDKVVANGRDEKKKIMDAFASADGTKGSNEKSKKMFSLMDYGPVVEEVLKEDPSFCGNATKIHNAVEGGKHKNMVVSIGAVVAGAVATGGLASALGAGAALGTAASSAAALGASGALIYKPDYDRLQAANSRVGSNAHSIEGKLTAGKEIGDVKDIEEARDALAMDIATLPLDFMGFGIYKGAKNLVVGAKDAALVGKLKFLDRPLAMSAAKKALAKQGLSELQITKVLADLKSLDGVVSGRALTQLMKALDVNSDEVRILQNLYRTGVVKEADGRSAYRALARVRAVPAEQRPEFLARMDEVLANINTAKVNAANRDDVLNAAASGMQFGADPKKVAAIVTDWDPSGLDGLARAYDIAGKKMDLPEVRGLASLELKQEKALRAAIDDMMTANPEFRAMPPAEKAAAQEQMLGCALKGK